MFHLKDNFEKSLGATFIALIQKKVRGIGYQGFNSSISAGNDYLSEEK